MAYGAGTDVRFGYGVGSQDAMRCAVLTYVWSLSAQARAVQCPGPKWTEVASGGGLGVLKCDLGVQERRD
eukprot:2926254-Rhodomonas_salina.1